ncbi:MAG: lysophospholipase [Lachnospiraceae bacterium]|nr:lysophospholipase [Lachnospiraceae bacterium]
MLKEFEFLSYNKRDKVQAWIYGPMAEPKGVIQLIHGFGEHSRRYLHMISKFLEADYIVVADDHVGHGKTAIVNNSWGDWGDKGFHTMREDEYQLTKIAKESYPDLPYYIFGHSMGSFITRDYLTEYGDGIDGVIICGTGRPFPDAVNVKNKIQKAVDEGKGDEVSDEFVQDVLGWFANCIPDTKVGNEWICGDPWVQKDHIEDPFNAFTQPIISRSLLYFSELCLFVDGEEWAKKVPTSIPIFNIAGDKDPVGGFGAGVMEISDFLTKTGHNVTTKLYPGRRHEIFNYKEIRNEVAEDVISFLQTL